MGMPVTLLNWTPKNAYGRSIGNIINNIVITLYGEHFVTSINVESLCCTPEMNMSTVLQLRNILNNLKIARTSIKTLRR